MVDSSTLSRDDRVAARSTGSSARAARRWFLVLAPVLAGLLAIGGALADPGVDLDGEAMYRIYADEPGPLQWKSVLYHFSYAVWGFAALMLAGRGPRAGGAGWPPSPASSELLGISSMPGFLLADFYDSAIGQVYWVDGTLACGTGRWRTCGGWASWRAPA